MEVNSNIEKPQDVVNKEYVDRNKKLSIRRLGNYIYEASYDTIPEYEPTDLNSVYGACSAYVRDGKLYRNLDFPYDKTASFKIVCKDFVGISFIRGMNDGELDNDKVGQLPYHIADGINNDGIMIATLILHNDFNNYAGSGTKENDITTLPYYVLSNLHSISNISSVMSSFLANLKIPTSLTTSGNLLHFLITNGTTSYTITPKTDGSAYEIVDITALPKLTNFKWVNKASLVRNDSDLQLHPQGIERWNLIESIDDLSQLRYTLCYESADRLSEFIGLDNTDKNSTDEVLTAIYNTARTAYLARTRDDENPTWQTVYSVVYSSKGIEHLNVQEDWKRDYAGFIPGMNIFIPGMNIKINDGVIDTTPLISCNGTEDDIKGLIVNNNTYNDSSSGFTWIDDKHIRVSYESSGDMDQRSYVFPNIPTDKRPLGSYEINTSRELTFEEFNALPQEVKDNGTVYFISDDIKLTDSVLRFHFTNADGSTIYNTISYNNGATLDSLKLSPELNADWNSYDNDGDADRLFYGYVDSQDYNKRYYFNKNNQGKYEFISKSTGTIYYNDSILPTNKSLDLYPKYIDAGYAPITTVISKDSSDVANTFYEVYIPESEPVYPYSETDTSNGNDSSSKYASSNPKIFNDYMTNDLHKVPAMYVMETIPQRGWLYNMLYQNPACSISGTTIKITDSSGSHTYTLSANTAIGTGTSQGLNSYNTKPTAAWSYNSFGDSVIIANILTRLYNIQHTDKPLKPVYYSNSALTTELTSGATAEQASATAFYVDNTANGYRLPKCYEFEYFSRIIIDERQMPACRTLLTANGATVDLFVRKNQGLKYNYKSVKDDTYYVSQTNGGDYIGSSSGLALYDSSTGEFNRGSLRNWWQSMGRSSATTGNELDPQDTSNYNTRNGAGLYSTFGVRWHWCDTWYNYTSSRVSRGSSYGSSASSFAYNLRLAYVNDDTPSYRSAHIGVRFCRNV